VPERVTFGRFLLLLLWKENVTISQEAEALAERDRMRVPARIRMDS
jgi:hypothetical protein